MSAIGSVIIIGFPSRLSSPTGFTNARDQAGIGLFTETDATDAELAVNGTGPTTISAAIFLSGRKLWLSLSLGDVRFTCPGDDYLTRCW
jgi:hypothetical protein